MGWLIRGTSVYTIGTKEIWAKYEGEGSDGKACLNFIKKNARLKTCQTDILFNYIKNMY